MQRLATKWTSGDPISGESWIREFGLRESNFGFGLRWGRPLVRRIPSGLVLALHCFTLWASFLVSLCGQLVDLADSLQPNCKHCF